METGKRDPITKKTGIIASINNVARKPTPKTIIGTIFFALFLFFLTNALWTPLYNIVKDWIYRRPNVVVNILKLKHATVAGEKGFDINNSILAYFNDEDHGTLFVLDSSILGSIGKESFLIQGLDFNFTACPECTYYWITVTNTNYNNIEKVVLDIKTQYLPEISVYSPKIITAKCGGMFDGKGCYVVIENLAKREPAVFTLVIPNTYDNISVSSKINNKYSCDIRYLHGFANTFMNHEKGIMLSNKLLHFPRFWNDNMRTMYVLDLDKLNTTENPWRAIGGKTESIKK